MRMSATSFWTVGLALSTWVGLGCAKEGKDADNGNNPGGTREQSSLFGLEPEARPTPASLDGHDRLFGVRVDAQNNVFAGGSVADSTATSADFAMVVTKILPTGELDPTFGTGGMARHNIVQGANGELTRGIALLPDGKIVAVGTVEHVGAADPRDRDIAVLRLDATGARDAAFGTDGVVILDLSDGEMVGTGFVADAVWAWRRIRTAASSFPARRSAWAAPTATLP